MRKLTYAQVKALAICNDQPKRFLEEYGQSVAITEDAVEAAMTKFHLDYLCYSMIQSVLYQHEEASRFWIEQHNTKQVARVLPKTKLSLEEIKDWKARIRGATTNLLPAERYYEFLKSF